MTLRNYPVVLFDEGGDPRYGVVVPDLLGCVSTGETIDEALANVREAIGGHLALMAAHRDEIPSPGEIQSFVDGDPEYYQDGIWAYVELNLPVGQAA